MGVAPSPEEALSPEAFYSLYLGGLSQQDQRERLQTSYTLLLLGRLGMQPDEILHLHEGWIDWERGAIQIPARDPCACSGCWDRAQMRQRRGDSRMLTEIVSADFWRPPDENGERRLSFGWSRRLTAVINGVLAESQYLPGDHETIQTAVKTAASKARGVDPEAVSVTALRASAIQFLATAGFGPRRLADLCAIDEESAGEFVRVSGGEHRDHLYRVLAEVDPPPVCGDGSEYRIVCDEEPFEREPFDPQHYDQEWRTERASRSPSRQRNPRPASPPPHVDFDPEEAFTVSEPAGDSGPGIVAQSLREWVNRREQQRHDTTQSTSSQTTQSRTDPDQPQQTAEPSEPTETETATRETRSDQTDQETTDTDDPLSKVTEPVEFSVDTRFVAADFEGGKPTGGSVILGQEELLFLSRDDTGISGMLRVSLDWIVNIAPGYVPEPLEGLFEDTVGLAYEDNERQIIVTEIPPKHRWQFTHTIFSYVLDDASAVVTHRPDWEASPGPEQRTIELESGKLRLNPAAEDGARTTIRLDMVVDAQEGKMKGEDGYERGIVIKHLQTDGNLIRTEVRPTTERSMELLKRYLKRFIEKENRKANRVHLDSDGFGILESLYEDSGGGSIGSMLQQDQDQIADIMETLVSHDLIVDTTKGRRLTGVGYRVVSDEFET